MKALIYLELSQLINSIKNILRSPKRLIPTLLIVVWVGGWFVQGLLLLVADSPSHQKPDFGVLREIPIETVEMIVFLFLSIGSALVVYGAFSSSMLIFNISHIDFLFPTPISRRKVLLFKLLKDYLKLGMWIAFFFLFLGSPVYSMLRVSMLPWGAVSIAAITALALTVLNLAHTINIVFTLGYERLRQTGILIKAVIILVPVSSVAYGLYHFSRTSNGIAGIVSAVESPVMNVVFAPAKWAAGLFLAPLTGVTPEQWGQFGLLWLLAAGSFVLLLSRNENVYEPSLGVSIKFAQRRAAARSGDFAVLRVAAMREKGSRRVSGLGVPPFGRGANAFLWKNLITRYRLYRTQLVLMAILPLLVVAIMSRFLPADLKRGAPFVLTYLVWMLSLSAQSEIRSDLKYANTIKPMPIKAWKLVLAQVISSVCYLTGGVLLLSGYLWLAVPEARNETLVVFMIIMPSLGFANIAAITIPSLMYPDISDASQNYLCSVFSFLLTLFPSVLTIITLLMPKMLSAPIYVVVTIVCLINILFGMAGVVLSGELFRKFDPTSD
ncbi:MAG: putative ABC exporter domain-containing protein [Armatimonadetes bacterium]|nr:putative ABC exporter domain-containing protein [Armatimonadota bacterium]